jgi:hypothetical protein
VGLCLLKVQANYSFCGSFNPLSKLIIILVMIRGRHRGLPVAIDRAVLLPFEFQQEPDEDDSDKSESGQTADPSTTVTVTNTQTIHEEPRELKQELRQRPGRKMSVNSRDVV